jgi:hypothetical protein
MMDDHKKSKNPNQQMKKSLVFIVVLAAVSCSAAPPAPGSHEDPHHHIARLKTILSVLNDTSNAPENYDLITEIRHFFSCDHDKLVKSVSNEDLRLVIEAMGPLGQVLENERKRAERAIDDAVDEFNRANENSRKRWKFSGSEEEDNEAYTPLSRDEVLGIKFEQGHADHEPTAKFPLGHSGPRYKNPVTGERHEDDLAHPDLPSPADHIHEDHEDHVRLTKQRDVHHTADYNPPEGEAVKAAAPPPRQGEDVIGKAAAGAGPAASMAAASAPVGTAEIAKELEAQKVSKSAEKKAGKKKKRTSGRVKDDLPHDPTEL